MDFTWDEEKSAGNLRDRGFDFAFATLIFGGPTLEKEKEEEQFNVSEKRGARRTSQERPIRGRADFVRLGARTESDISATSPPELTDLPDAFWDDATLVLPEPKEPISIRVDRDVLAWFREEGAGYQTRMNAVLRSYMEARTRR